MITSTNELFKHKYIPARRAGVSLEEAWNWTKFGSETDCGRYEPTAASLACEGEGECNGITVVNGTKRVNPLRNCLLAWDWWKDDGDSVNVSLFEEADFKEEEKMEDSDETEAEAIVISLEREKERCLPL